MMKKILYGLVLILLFSEGVYWLKKVIRKPISKIEVQAADRVCQNDDDCVAVEVDCNVDVDELGAAVNKLHKAKYMDLVFKCRAGRALAKCDCIGKRTATLCIAGQCEFDINRKPSL